MWFQKNEEFEFSPTSNKHLKVFVYNMGNSNKRTYDFPRALLPLTPFFEELNLPAGEILGGNLIGLLIYEFRGNSPKSPLTN